MDDEELERLSDGKNDSKYSECIEGTAASNSWFCEEKWNTIKSIFHEYLITFPRNLKRQQKLNIELPYPIYSSNKHLDIDYPWKPFRTKPVKSDSRLDYYRKVYSKSKQKLLIEDLRRGVLSVPHYVIDLAVNTLNVNSDDVWCYNGGLLECLSVNGSSYLCYASSADTISCVDLNEQNLVSTVTVDASMPIYNIKCQINANKPLLAARQKSKIHLFKSVLRGSKTKCVWSKETDNSFVDMSFDRKTDYKFYTLDSNHILSMEDIAHNKTVAEYSLLSKEFKLTDYLANILLIKSNTLCFMNRRSISILDLRSKSIKTKLFKDGLECDELCTLSKKNSRSIYVTSMHNILEIDWKALDCSNKVMHLLPSPVFISSLAKTKEESYLCLTSQNDSIVVKNVDQLSLPETVPKITDTLTATCSTVKLHNLNVMDGRLSHPITGMKLYIDPATEDICLFTCNSAGDVFKQRILNEDSSLVEPVSLLGNWIKGLSSKPKKLGVTNIRNLNKIFHSVTAKLPHEESIRYLMNEDSAEVFVEKYFPTIERDIQSTVGKMMNALWDDGAITKSEDSGVSSQDKVMEWLQFTS